jgi:hypothetical protein
VIATDARPRIRAFLIYALLAVLLGGCDSGSHPASVHRARSAPSELPPLAGRIVASKATGQDLVLIDLSSRHITTLMKTNTLEDGPTWAPGGRTFAYEGYLGPNPEDGDAIFKMKVRGRDVTKVVDVCESDAHPAWAPNGRLIAFDGACDNISVVASRVLRELTTSRGPRMARGWLSPHGRNRLEARSSLYQRPVARRCGSLQPTRPRSRQPGPPTECGSPT